LVGSLLASVATALRFARDPLGLVTRVPRFFTTWLWWRRGLPAFVSSVRIPARRTDTCSRRRDLLCHVGLANACALQFEVHAREVFRPAIYGLIKPSCRISSPS
jgi:hypothetical protein